MSSADGRGLVLGGGGVTGIAWEIGVLAGLAEAGIELSTADVVVGTSAGSVVGALLLGVNPLDAVYRAQLADPQGEVAARIPPRALFRFLLSSFGEEQRARARLGRAALRSRTVPEVPLRELLERWIGEPEWPARRLLVTAVDAGSGEERVFDRDSGIPLLEAVTASCSVPLVWPPATIDGHRYMDGGARSIANADLAAGCSRVVVLAPVTVGLRPSSRIGRQLGSLGPGVRSVVVSPDSQARRAFGRNVLDPASRPAAARAGRDQAAAVAAAVAAVWG